MKRTWIGAALVVIGLGVVVHAEEPKAGAKDAVQVRMAAKADTALRFRLTTSSSTEVDGTTVAQESQTQEFSVKVKSEREDGGREVEVTIESLQVQQTSPRGTLEIDTSKPAGDAPAGMAAVMDTVSRAMTGRAFTVTLDARGKPTGVTGFREAVASGMKGSPYEAMFPVEQAFDDSTVLQLADELFAPAPATAMAIGGTATAEEKHEISGQPLDFAAEVKLASATADEATVESKLTWKPGDEATADGAKAAGGGTSTARFSRKDGFAVSVERKLEAARETDTMSATSQATYKLERIAAKADKPADTPKTDKPTDTPKTDK